jgi:hypothetical protein
LAIVLKLFISKKFKKFILKKFEVKNFLKNINHQVNPDQSTNMMAF